MIKVRTEMILTIHTGRGCFDTSFDELITALSKFTGCSFSFDWIPFYAEQVKLHLEKYLPWLKEASEKICAFEDWNEATKFIESLCGIHGNILILPAMEGDQSPTEGDWNDHANMLKDRGIDVITLDDLDS